MAEIKQPPRQRLGLDWLQMRDTICDATGRDYYLLISLSSRRREGFIAQMQTVKSGGREDSDQASVTNDQKLR